MKFVWSPLAVERALEAKAYIAADNPRAADKWASGLVNSVSRLKRHPKLGRVVPEVALEEYRQILYSNCSSLGAKFSVAKRASNSFDGRA